MQVVTVTIVQLVILVVPIQLRQLYSNIGYRLEGVIFNLLVLCLLVVYLLVAIDYIISQLRVILRCVISEIQGSQQSGRAGPGLGLVWPARRSPLYSTARGPTGFFRAGLVWTGSPGGSVNE
jgi:hypothetical protein